VSLACQGPTPRRAAWAPSADYGTSRVGKQDGPALHARPAPGLASLDLSTVDAESIIRAADAGTPVDRVIFLPLAQLPIPDIGWRPTFDSLSPERELPVAAGEDLPLGAPEAVDRRIPPVVDDAPQRRT
jgi:hypothetical protein